jgi:hypothetical protein
MTQNFHRGDLVMVKGGHRDGEALVIGSYADQYGPGGYRPHETYTLLFTDDGSEISWFDDEQLTMIRQAEKDAITVVKERREKQIAEQSELPWIVANWDPKEMSGASLESIFTACGGGSMWGRNGEGIQWYENALKIMALFDDVMKTGDIEKVRERIEMIRTATLQWREDQRKK